MMGKTSSTKAAGSQLFDDLPPLTPTQRRLVEVLNDGRRHTPEELRTCIDDELSHKRNLNVHIYWLRKQLNSVGRDVVYESSALGTGYRLTVIDQ